ncbi:MAG: hypothetical protein ACHBNF_11070 [Chromatiales bacterium]
MSWLTITWSMGAAACLTLALMYLAIWFQQPRQRAYLLFSLTALGAAGNAVLELLVMHAQTVANYATALRWSHLPIFVLVVSMTWFVRAYFGTGRRWLAFTVTSLWTLTLLLNFRSPHSTVYTEITGLITEQTSWGEVFSVARGVYSPWNLIANLGIVFLVAFVVDASLALWRQGGRRRAAAR